MTKGQPARFDGLTRAELIRAIKAQQARAKADRAKAARAKLALARLHRQIHEQREDLIGREQMIDASRNLYRELFDFAPIGYLTLDGRGIVLDVNKTACSMLGWDNENLVGRPFAALVRRGEAALFYGLLRNCRSKGSIRSDTLQIWSHGRSFPCHIWMQYVPRDLMFRAAIVDLSQQIQLEEDRRLARESEQLAKATSDAKDEFIAMLSHELRTPLTPIVAAASALCRRQDLPSAINEQAVTILRNAELEARLIDDLLDITRIRQNKLTLSPRVVDVHATLSETLHAFHEQIGAKSVRTRVSLSAARYHVRADPVRLRQVFANLIDNAVKFTPPGGEIGLFSRYDDEQLTVAVRDSGVGMTQGVLDHLFSPFERVPDASRQLGGLGLGLAISKRLVDAQSGTIRASSEGPGSGSLFEVTFPTAPSPVVAGTDGPPPETEAAPVRPMTILVVEDHHDSAEMLAVLLSSEGHTVKIAANVHAALQLAQEGCDLLISDIALPDGTGIDLFRMLRAERPVSGIALSGYGGADIENRSKLAGFSEHLVKPVNFERLMAVVNRVASRADSATSKD